MNPLSPRPALGAALAAAAALVLGAVAAPPASQGADKVSFVKQVQPILEGKCVGCHGAQKAKSGYRMDTKAAALKGGEIADSKKRPAVVPGKSGDSLLIDFVTATAEDKAKDVHPMPPKQGDRLAADQVALLKKWIDEGADWPDGVTLKGKGRGR
jgi:mono/diheme cytochrome c family protein